MVEIVEDGNFDRRISPQDWRFSAAALGIIRYLKKMGKDYKVDGDILYYKSSDILDKESYLKYVEVYYKNLLHHVFVENLLNKNEKFTEEMTKIVNSRLSGNSICKKVFKSIKFDGENKDVILKKINDNRLELIESTYKNAHFGYGGYCNSNAFWSEENRTSRLIGYNVDAGRKTKALSFNWDIKTLVVNDFREFDYIPLGFTPTRESYFINNNYDVLDMLRVNDYLLSKVSGDLSIDLETDENEKGGYRTQRELFFGIATSSSFIDNDIEIIRKDRPEKDKANNYFKTIFLRKDAINLFENLNEDKNFALKAFNYSVKLDGDNNYLNLMEIFINNIINNIRFDLIIEKLLKINTKKTGRSYSFQVSQFINANHYLYGGNTKMFQKKSWIAREMAKEVVASMKKRKSENKISSYRHKLISSLVANNYDKFNETLLQLSSYSQVKFNFAYELFDNFEEYKNMAYSFVNALENYEKKNGGKNEK